MWLPGDCVPDFFARCSNGNPTYHFSTAAGRYLVLCFFGSAALKKNLKALAHIAARKDFFNDEKAAFFGISVDSRDESLALVKEHVPGVRYFWDFDFQVSRLYRAMGKDSPADKNAGIGYNSFTLVIDPMLRVMACISLENAEEHNLAFDAVIDSLPGINDHAGCRMQAPVLILPRVFEPEFCRQLISLYDTHGGTESGFMREVDGKTVGIFDNSFKRRKDYTVTDQKIIKNIQARIWYRMVPMIKKAFQFNATRMERYLVACYDSESGGFFNPHHDNTTKGTAHRRFAVTINLNAEEYDGGNLRFPEFGQATYRAPTGGAVVFSCSLLHEATSVTKGKRYAFLPFLYDDAAAKIREENMGFLAKETIDKNKGESEY